MKPVGATIPPQGDNKAKLPDGNADTLKPGNAPPKVNVLNKKLHPMHQDLSSQASTPLPQSADLNQLPSSEPRVLPRQQQTPVSEARPASAAQRKKDDIELANHVSLQIFSTEVTSKNKNAILFLNGGPGLAYDDTFDNLTSWSLDHGYTLVAPEITGSSKPGLEDTSDSFASPPNYVRDLQSVVHYFREHPDFREKEFCVVAHSWGGFQRASFLTNDSISSDDKNFFRQVVFISPNLDSAHTRIFSQRDEIGGPTYEVELQNELTRRHAGNNSHSSGKISFVNNPVMNKNLNEAISPFYRRDQMPKGIPCLFVHPVKDSTVPLSQSLAAAEKINSEGGNAKMLITTNGGHVFFKTGKVNDPEATAVCFGAIDSLVRNPDSLASAMTDDESLAHPDSEHIELSIKAKDSQYESQKNLLTDWHRKDEASEGAEKTNKFEVMKKLKAQKEAHLKKLEERVLTKHDGYTKTSQSLAMINQFLESQ